MPFVGSANGGFHVFGMGMMVGVMTVMVMMTVGPVAVAILGAVSPCMAVVFVMPSIPRGVALGVRLCRLGIAGDRIRHHFRLVTR
jgi:hypothetical protein